MHVSETAETGRFLLGIMRLRKYSLGEVCTMDEIGCVYLLMYCSINN